MLIQVTLTKWQDSRDSSNKVSKADLPAGRLFLLNTDCISDIIVNGTGSKFYYTENPFDEREGKSYIECSSSVATIIAGFNATFGAHYMTLPIYTNNDITRHTINTTIPVAVFMLAHADNAHPTTASWVTYVKDGFIRKEVLVALSLTELYNLVSEPLLDYDGNEYTTVVIGTQEWIVQNFRCTTYGDGTPIPNVTDNILWPADVTGAYCWYNHDIANAPIYGGLYNWYAVDNAHGLAYFTRNGVQEVGWRVPTVVDWDALVTALGGSYALAGNQLKEIGIAHWIIDTNATDEVGFRGRGAGNRFVDDDTGDGFENMGVFLDMWTADEDPMDIARAFSVYLSTNSPYFNHWEHEKFGGMAIRCVRTI